MKTWCVLCLLLVFCGDLLPLHAQKTFRVMTYNVENLFDCRHDSLKEDTEFLPDSKRRWTSSRYWKKLNLLSKVIAAAGEERIPDLIGLCEVENDSVMVDLTRRSALRTLDYQYIMTHSPDVRGIDVALLYQPGFFKPVASHEVVIPSLSGGFRPTRNILYVKGLTLTGDTLHVAVCHFPSRLGNSRVSRRHRMLAARTLRMLVDSVRASVVEPDIIVMGDFNASLKDEIFRKTLHAVPAADIHSTPGSSDRLYEPLCVKNRAKEIKASYRYKGIWEDIDHILVSGALLDETRCFYTRNGARTVFALPFMCEKDATYGGERPFRTYLGPYYKGGVSDHFPVLVDFVLREE